MLWRLMFGLHRHDEEDTGYINASHLRSKDFEQPEWEYIAAQARPWRLCHCPSRYCVLDAQVNCHARRNQHRHVSNPFKLAPDNLARAHASTCVALVVQMPSCITQGPLFHTVPDFWRMVYESGSQMIVMLTRTEEENIAGQVGRTASVSLHRLLCWRAGPCQSAEC